MADGGGKPGEIVSMEGIDLLRITSYGPQDRKPDIILLAQHDGGPEQLIPRIQHAFIDPPEVVAEYMEINRDVGSAELAHVTAQEIVNISEDLRVDVLEACIPREIVDPNRVSEFAVRNVLNPEGSKDVVDFLLRIHQKIVEVIDEHLYGLLENSGVFIDVHTMSPFSPKDMFDEQPGRLVEFIDLWKNRARQKDERRFLNLITQIPEEGVMANPVLIRNFLSALENKCVNTRENNPYPRPGYPAKNVLSTRRMLAVPGMTADVPKDYLSVAEVDDPEWDLGKIELNPRKVQFLARIFAAAAARSVDEFRQET